MAMHFIEKYGLLALRIPSKFDMRRFCRATGSVAIVKLQAPQPDELGFAKQVCARVVCCMFVICLLACLWAVRTPSLGLSLACLTSTACYAAICIQGDRSVCCLCCAMSLCMLQIEVQEVGGANCVLLQQDTNHYCDRHCQ
jgi:hypothetical protein